MEAAENDVRLRKSAMLNDTEIVSVIQEVLTAKRLDETLERMRTSFATERRNGLDGQLQQIAALEHLSETSIVAKRSGISYNVAEGAESTLLSFSGKTVKLPKAAAAIVHALENVSRVKVAALLAHDPKALGIVKRLIQEGFAIQCESPDYAGRESVA
jgi:hypothetical protein